MIRRGKKFLYNFLNKRHERSILTKKNVAASFGIKVITIFISFLLVPLTISYANSVRYGIWITVYQMVLWMNFFDLGFGNGLKNRLAEVKAQGKTVLAQKYISSTYAIMSIICIVIFFLFLCINPFLKWNQILPSIPDEYQSELPPLVWVCIVSFCMIFVLNLLKTVLTADQRPAIGSFLDMIGQLMTLICIFILSKTVAPSLLTLGLAATFAQY